MTEKRMTTAQVRRLRGSRSQSARRGAIACEFCPRTIGGSTKSGTFSNYISHVAAAHEGGAAPFREREA